MLRDEMSGTPALHDVLELFEIGDEVLTNVRQFRMLSDNRFVWQLEMSDFMYYLYAEDFVESLEEVTDTIRVVSDGTPGELVPVKTPVAFEDASPVTSNSVYERPTDYDKISHYAGESGYDFVFLYRTEQRAEEFEDEL